MSLGYDLSCPTLSQEGKSLQVEYANKAVEESSSVAGLVCKDGVILIREKYIPSVAIVPGSNPTTYPVTKTIGMVFGGLYPDGRALVKQARENAASYLENFGIDIKGEHLTEKLAANVTKATLTWNERPFGSTALIASSEEGKYKLHMIETTGNSNEYYACAQGKGRIFIKAEIERENFKIHESPVDEALMELMKIMIKSYEGTERIEYDISLISDATGGIYKKLSFAEIEAIRETATKLLQDEDAMEN